MTVGSWNYSTGDIIHTGSWNGDDDLPKKQKVNPYSKGVLYQHNPSAKLYYVDGATYYYVKPTSVSDQWSVDDETGLTLRLANAAASAIKGHSFNLAVTLGESRESLITIAESAKGIARILRDPVRTFNSVLRTFKDPARAESAARDAWLAERYGWRPLLTDAYEAGNAAGAILAPRSEKLVVTAYGTARIDVSGGFPVGGGWESPGRSMHRKSVHITLSEPLSLADSLGLTDPASLAWELRPFSYVVDWFLPIGSWLNARAVLGSVVSSSVFYTSKTVVKFHGVTAKNGWTGIHPLTRSQMSFQRSGPSSLTGLTSATPQFRDFRKVFSGDSGVKRVFDSLALLSQVRNGLIFQRS